MAIANYLALAIFLVVTHASIFNQDQSDNEISVAHVYADTGSNVSLPCLPQSLSSDVGRSLPSDDKASVSWVREGKALQHSKVESDGTLFLSKIELKDAGLYICQIEDFYMSSEDLGPRTVAQVQLHIKTTPPPPASVSIYPSTVLALVTWKLNGTGGYEIKQVSVIYQKLTDDPDNPAWHRTFPEHVGPGMTQLEVYKLEPNTTYRFRVWATNKLGPGGYTERLATTKPIFSEEPHHVLSQMHHTIDSRPWIVAVTVVFLSFGVAVVALAILVVQNRRLRSRRRMTCDSSEDLELVPNIITNPNYEGNEDATGSRYPDENSNNQQAFFRLNNNCVVRPVSL